MRMLTDVVSRSSTPDYALLAPHYWWCESLIFGTTLQRCRTAFASQLTGRVLSIGEGNGRFASHVNQKKPGVFLVAVEPDSAMRAQGKKRAPATQWRAVWPDADEKFKTIILNFVIDCCDEEELSQLLGQAMSALEPSGELIIADFHPSDLRTSFGRNLAALLVRAMYLFFRVTTGMRGRKILSYAEILHQRGWHRVDRKVWWGGFIAAEKWTATVQPT